MMAMATLALAPAAQAAPGANVAYSIEHSSVLAVKAADGHEYRVMVAWPEGAPPAAGWPVLYVLDGDDNFAVVTQTLRRLVKAGPGGGVAPRLIVGVESGSLARRVFDYTPATPGWTIPAGAPAAGLATGGADRFLDTLAGPVAAEVAARWPIDRRRQAIIGHSFGGLLGLHAFFTRPDQFDSVVAVSPSLWFGGELLAKEEAGFRVMKRRESRLMVAAGGAERGPLASPPPAPGEGLVGRLKALTPAADAVFLDLPGQSHGSTFLAGLTPALGFISERDRK